MMGNGESSTGIGLSREEEKDVLDYNCSLENLIDRYISETEPKKIVVMAGAGISGMASIPFSSTLLITFSIMWDSRLPNPWYRSL